MPVPDVAVPVLRPAVGSLGERLPCSQPSPAQPSAYLATKSLLTSRKMKKHSSWGV